MFDLEIIHKTQMYSLEGRTGLDHLSPNKNFLMERVLSLLPLITT